MQSTTVTSINTTTASLKDIYFPGVVLCNVNQVSKAFLRSINVYDEEAKVLFDEFLDGNPQLWKKSEETGIEDPIYAKNKKLLEPIKNEMKNMYNWSATESFIKLANQVGW